MQDKYVVTKIVIWYLPMFLSEIYMKPFAIYGMPVPLNRPRAFRKGNSIGMYDGQKKIKDMYRGQMEMNFNQTPFSVPIHLDLTFHFPIPKGTSRVRTREMLDGRLVPMKRPDLDNLVKFILDCMNGIVFDDDSQVTDFHAKKIFGLEPMTIITILPQFHTKAVTDESNSGSGQ